MTATYWKKKFYDVDYFTGEKELIDKYHMTSRHLKDGTLAFYIGRTRVHNGSWIVQEAFSTKKPQIYSDYAFRISGFHGGD